MEDKSSLRSDECVCAEKEFEVLGPPGALCRVAKDVIFFFSYMGPPGGETFMLISMPLPPQRSDRKSIFLTARR
jgi:hypothetical protein